MRQLLVVLCLLLGGLHLSGCMTTTASCGTGRSTSGMDARVSAQGEDAVVRPQSVGAGVVVGVLFEGLQGLLGSIDNLLKSSSGEVQIVLGSLRTSVANTLVEFKSLLGDDLNHTVDHLNNIQREFVDNVERLLLLGQRSVQALITGVTDSALTLVREADIAAYDALYALPGRPQSPRVVYWTPRELSADGADSVLELRGNFLNVQPPKVKLDGVAVEPAGIGNNVTQVRFATAAAGTPPSGTYRKVDVEYTSCEPQTCFLWEDCQPKLGKVQASASVKVVPRKSFTVRATVAPVGRQLEKQSFPFNFYQIENNCAINLNSEAEHCLTAGWELDAPLPNWPNVTQKNCGSDVSQLFASGDRCVRVRYSIKGCGCTFGSSCQHPDAFCKGRGWLRYDLQLPGRRFVDTTFTAQSFQVENSSDRTFAFRYSQPLPAGSRVDRYQYTVTITSSTGGTVTLSDAAPNAPSAQAVMRDGTLSVQITEPALVLSTEQGGGAQHAALLVHGKP